MKSSILMFVLLCTVLTKSLGQHNYKFNYQAAVRNSSGTLVPNGSTVFFKLSILGGSSTGTVLYSETQSKVVNLVIGDGTATVGTILFSGNFQDLSQEKYLKVEVDPLEVVPTLTWVLQNYNLYPMQHMHLLLQLLKMAPNGLMVHLHQLNTLRVV